MPAFMSLVNRQRPAMVVLAHCTSVYNTKPMIGCSILLNLEQLETGLVCRVSGKVLQRSQSTELSQHHHVRGRISPELLFGSRTRDGGRQLAL